VTTIPTINIPTELLRTLIAVVDLRSFTKAAHALGVTQPAVSAQVKRLQLLLGLELFDKSAPGVTLTPHGELIVNYARRMLAVNDQILNLVMPGFSNPPLRVGIPGDFAGSILPRAIAGFQARMPHLRFLLRGDTSESLLRDLRQGQLDVVVALSISESDLDARHSWREPLVWIRGEGAVIDPGAPVPLVTLRQPSMLHRITTSALSQGGRDYDIVFTATAAVGLVAAVSAGLGVALLPRHEVPNEVEIWNDAPLPKPLDLYCGIYLRDGSDRETIEQLADTMAEALRLRAAGGPSTRPEPVAPAVAATHRIPRVR